MLPLIIKPMIDTDTYLSIRDAMPTCPICDAATCGNLTCRACRQVNREAHQKHGWSVEFLDRLDEINPELMMPAGAEEVRRFMERISVT